MNTAGNNGDDAERGKLRISFNQNCTSLAIGTRSGFLLCSLDCVDNLERIHCNENEKDVWIAERLFSSSLIAMVSLAMPRKLRLCHFKKGTEICSYSYPSCILAVHLNRQRLIVCLEESLYIHNIRDMKVMHIIKETPANKSGLCALSPGDDESYLAYPGSLQSGNVQIFDSLKLRSVAVLNAHSSPIAAIAFNPSGNKMATASEKGTVIRVFSLPEGVRLHDFRRGLKRCVAVSSLAFSADSVYLAASSNTETVHVFKMEVTNAGTVAEDTAGGTATIANGWANYVAQALIRTSATYLPAQVTDVFSQSRAFATAHLPTADLRTICCIVSIQKMPTLLVATDDGVLYIYSLNCQEGGECSLVRQHRFSEPEQTHTPTSAAIRENSVLASPLSNSVGPDAEVAGGAAASELSTAETGQLISPAGKQDASLTTTAECAVNSGVVVAGSNSNRGDASYAYKLKRSPRLAAGPATVSQELKEIVDNVPDECFRGQTSFGITKEVPAIIRGSKNGLNGVALRLDDFSEFPPVS